MRRVVQGHGHRQWLSRFGTLVPDNSEHDYQYSPNREGWGNEDATAHRGPDDSKLEDGAWP